MKNAILIIIAMSFMTLSKAQNKSPILDAAELETKVDNLVKLYQDLDIFSGVVLIAEQGKPVYHKAFGLANRESKTPNTLNTKFDIGSMNKTFTKLVILQLIKEGKLKKEDNLGKYLTGFPAVAANKITINDLLRHSSGFGSYWGPEYRDLPFSEKGISGILEIIKKTPLKFEPGTDRQYSNSGYVVLGAIIEKVTGKSYSSNVQDRIVTPLELKNTYLSDKSSVPHRAIGYYKNIRGEIKNNQKMVEVPTPAGGFQSTTADILKFYRDFHYGNIVLSKEEKMKDESFARIQEHNNTGGAIPHAGGFPGANTVDYEILRDRITVIVFANMDEPVAEQLGVGILAIIRNKTPKNPSLPAIQSVYNAYMKHGIEFVQTNFDSLISNFHESDPKALILNNIGYNLLEENEIDQALEIFQLNTIMFSENPNVWDSYGEAHLKNGDRSKAMKYYQKALSIDPDFPSALKMVKELEDY